MAVRFYTGCRLKLCRNSLLLQNPRPANTLPPMQLSANDWLNIIITNALAHNALALPEALWGLSTNLIVRQTRVITLEWCINSRQMWAEQFDSVITRVLFSFLGPSSSNTEFYFSIHLPASSKSLHCAGTKWICYHKHHSIFPSVTAVVKPCKKWLE